MISDVKKKLFFKSILDIFSMDNIVNAKCKERCVEIKFWGMVCI